MRIFVRVTKNDIKYGKPFMSCECPIARATTRAMRRAGVRKGYAAIGGAKGEVCATKPKDFEIPAVLGYIRAVTPQGRKRAERFVRRFDAGKPVTPIQLSYEITPIE